MMETRVEKFSESYYLVPDLNAVSYSGDRVVVPNDLFDVFTRVSPDPILKLSEGHYRAHGEGGVPAQTVAVPDDVTHYDTEEVLLTRNEAAINAFFTGDP